MKVGVHKVAMAAPNDVSELAGLLDSGEVIASEIVALIGKTEGNGGANDFTRGYATLSYQLLLAKHLGITPDEVGNRVAFIWSGGTEGVLSPHATIFTKSDAKGTYRRAAPGARYGLDSRHRSGGGRYHRAGARGCCRRAQMSRGCRHR
jgi:cyanuric acid amidohydrolase